MNFWYGFCLIVEQHHQP